MNEPWPLLVTFFVCVFLIALGGIGMLFLLFGAGALVALAGIFNSIIKRRNSLIGGILIITLCGYALISGAYAILTSIPSRDFQETPREFIR